MRLIEVVEERGALTSSEREELTRLRCENQRLRMEREMSQKTFGCRAAASPAGRETLHATIVSAGSGAVAVRLLVFRNPLKNMVSGWIAYLIVVTLTGRSRLGK